jgi:hypothetical protein
VDSHRWTNGDVWDPVLFEFLRRCRLFSLEFHGKFATAVSGHLLKGELMSITLTVACISGAEWHHLAMLIFHIKINVKCCLSFYTDTQPLRSYLWFMLYWWFKRLTGMETYILLMVHVINFSNLVLNFLGWWLQDHVRTITYRDAIMHHQDLISGKVRVF